MLPGRSEQHLMAQPLVGPQRFGQVLMPDDGLRLRREDLGFAVDAAITVLVDATDCQLHAPGGRIDGHDRDPDRQRVAELHRLQELQPQRQAGGAGAGIAGAEQGGDQGIAQQAVGDEAIEPAGARVARLDLQGIDFAGDAGEELDVAAGDRADQFGFVAGPDLVDRMILEGGSGRVRCRIGAARRDGAGARAGGCVLLVHGLLPSRIGTLPEPL